MIETAALPEGAVAGTNQLLVILNEELDCLQCLFCNVNICESEQVQRQQMQ